MTGELGRGAGRVAVVVERYPCLSESFVRRDLEGLERFGFELAVVACAGARDADAWFSSGPRAAVFRPQAGSRGALHGVRRIPDSLRFARRARELFPPGLRAAAPAMRAALTAARLLPDLRAWRPDWLHAHFLGLPAAVAALMARRLGIPLTLSAHARDIFVPTSRLDRICAEARWITACSEHARASLLGRLPPDRAGRVLHVPHDVACGPPAARAAAPQDGPLRLLSVSRLVPKKGLDVVLQALALLHDVPYRYRIAGAGPEQRRLRDLARELGLERVEFLGALEPAAVAEELARADLFVLGTRTAPDGDRDGIPNSMLEAIATGVPVVVTDGGAVAEVVRHRRSGWLTPPNDPRALAGALREAATDPELRREVAETAHAELWRRCSSDLRRGDLAIRIGEELGRP